VVAAALGYAQARFERLVSAMQLPHRQEG